MVKNFVLDTNVLVHDPDCLEKFEDNILIIPFPVLEEIDKLKSKQGSLGQRARQMNRKLDEIRKDGDITKGVKLKSGGSVKILIFNEFNVTLPQFTAEHYKDNAILLYTLELKRRDKKPTILVTKDINLRVKADVLGIDTQDYLADKVEINELLSGVKEIDDASLRKTFTKVGSISVRDIEPEIFPNTFVDFGEGVYGRVDPEGKSVKKLSVNMDTSCWGIYPRNREQLFAYELLLDDRVKLISMPGIAGTGKTLLSLAAGMRKVNDEKLYERLLVSRPVIPMGQDIGYLPGSQEEKMKPWMQPIYDNLFLLFTNRHMDPDTFLKRSDKLGIEVLSYIRGRSIPNQFMIIDEAQNLTPHEVKTILTRIGEESKVILIGDPYQIDSIYLDTGSCGLVYAASRFISHPLAGHITLVKGERSELATAAAELL
ncbi:PhoH family protein [Kosmotoga arenicorallina S304]|uniref:PhoH family protein n=1 Tax=Kosmotoga arenicorallina S304 TaxID=1453497 RepID=A0A176K092_9BACT|nr:PhoH family protein [Kosmotoga arenicorallina]OAA30049.1 PhoH family protein [Kosmotoga arenicorallina S304]